MDLGFHPLYVIILLALALIVFGPSRLPKMGAQVGRMMREFQEAREGLTQQMREAFEERPEPVNVAEAGDAEPDVAVEAEREEEGGESSVAVLDPPADDVAESDGDVSDAPVVEPEAEAPEGTTAAADLETAPAIEESPSPAAEEAGATPLDTSGAASLGEATGTDEGRAETPDADAAATPHEDRAHA